MVIILLRLLRKLLPFLHLCRSVHVRYFIGGNLFDLMNQKLVIHSCTESHLVWKRSVLRNPPKLATPTIPLSTKIWLFGEYEKRNHISVSKSKDTIDFVNKHYEKNNNWRMDDTNPNQNFTTPKRCLSYTNMSDKLIHNQWKSWNHKETATDSRLLMRRSIININK